jgi:hypothetical protein
LIKDNRKGMFFKPFLCAFYYFRAMAIMKIDFSEEKNLVLWKEYYRYRILERARSAVFATLVYTVLLFFVSSFFWQMLLTLLLCFIMAAILFLLYSRYKTLKGVRGKGSRKLEFSYSDAGVVLKEKGREFNRSWEYFKSYDLYRDNIYLYTDSGGVTVSFIISKDLIGKTAFEKVSAIVSAKLVRRRKGWGKS